MFNRFFLVYPKFFESYVTYLERIKELNIPFSKLFQIYYIIQKDLLSIMYNCILFYSITYSNRQMQHKNNIKSRLHYSQILLMKKLSIFVYLKFSNFIRNLT